MLVRRPLVVIVLLIVLVGLGAMSFRRLPITSLPSIEAPIVSVTVSCPGASPADLVARVSVPIEDEIAGLEGVRHIRSSVIEGTSVSLVQFQSDARGKRALNDVKDAMARLKTRLPPAAGEPLVRRVEDFALPVVTYAVSASDRSPAQLSMFVDDLVRRMLQRVRGVAQVDRVGDADREVSIVLDPDRLQSLGLTLSMVGRQLRGAIGGATPGHTEVGGLDLSIRVTAPSMSIGDIVGFPIGLPRGGQVRLGDIGMVASVPSEPRSFVRFDGMPIVGFDVRPMKDASDLEVAGLVARAVADLHAAHPDVTFRLIETSTNFTSQSYLAGVQAFLAGVVLAVLVLLVFLRDLRAMAVVVVVVIASIVPTFWAMLLLAIPISPVSVLAFVMAIAFVVDDGTVEIDRVKRWMALGKPLQAGIEGAAPIPFAMIGVSLSIIIIFLWIGFIGAPAAQVFEQFGITTSILIFFSSLATCLTPTLAALLLKPSTGPAQPAAVARPWRSPLWPIRHAYLVAGLALIALGAMVFVLKMPAAVFLPVQDVGRSSLVVELPPGTPLSRTEHVTDEIAHRLRGRPDVRSVFLVSSADAPHQAALTIDYTPKAARAWSQGQLERAIGADLQTVPDIRYWFLNNDGLRTITFVVTGQDVGTVGNVAAEFARQIQRLPSVSNVTSSANLDPLELQVRPRRDAAARLGISAESLSETIRFATTGDVVPAFAKLDDGDRLVPIRIQLDPRIGGDRQRLEDLALPLPDNRGALPLDLLADLSWDHGPFDVVRYDRQIAAEVGADLVVGAAIGTTMRDIEALPIMTSLPPSVRIVPSGGAERFEDLSVGLLGCLCVPLVLVLALLVLLLRSFLQLLSIILSCLLTFGVVLVVLSLMQIPVSVPVYLAGLVVLGIVVKQAAGLVSVTTAEVRRGVPRDTALIDTCRQRALPLVVATIATVAALLPTFFMPGAGAEFRSPAALVVICGALTSAILSLVLVSAMFLAMDDVSRFVLRDGAKASASRPSPADQVSD